MKINEENPEEQKVTPSPYQDAGDDVEITEVYYTSPTKGQMMKLGKTIRKISLDGTVSYTLLDPSDRIMGPPVPDEETSRQIWSAVAEMLEQRGRELQEKREKDGPDQQQEKNH